MSTVSAAALLKEPWTSSCALLVFPGGADLPYCKTFEGDGNRRISQYVKKGGAYLGFCAGGYYGSARCEFEVDDKTMAVVGSRELAFFPGACRGAAFKGFKYASEAGARAAKLSVKTSQASSELKCYFNGGGVFVDAEKLEHKGVEVLASYDEDLDVEASDGKAAVVYCKVGQGNVVLTGPHPEYVLHSTSLTQCFNKSDSLPSISTNPTEARSTPILLKSLPKMSRSASPSSRHVSRNSASLSQKPSILRQLFPKSISLPKHMMAFGTLSIDSAKSSPKKATSAGSCVQTTPLSSRTLQTNPFLHESWPKP